MNEASAVILQATGLVRRFQEGGPRGLDVTVLHGVAMPRASLPAGSGDT